MKTFFLLPVINLLAVSNYPHIQLSSISQIDTTSIAHLLDGNIVEWPQEKFTVDKATKIRYAVDNDSQMLFLALNIPDKTTQQIIMQKGMNLFIDVKGKKKENRGVEFPLGMENVSDIGKMKVFGFTNAESVPQNVKTEGTINIAIGWDSSYALSIEYYIPLKMLEGSVTELNNKKISIGWKLKEDEMSTAQPVSTSSQTVSTTTRLVAVPAGTTPVGSRPPTTSTNRNVGTTQNNTFPQTNNTSKVQSIWTTHTIIF
ncbi:MAG TPA: hypothetical protein VGQ04_11490 [Chitinophagaceae bacterium]|jgi:hypothetical protein|nr:hypothetical protein [Chitinophagaceae bacterium]